MAPGFAATRPFDAEWFPGDAPASGAAMGLAWSWVDDGAAWPVTPALWSPPLPGPVLPADAVLVRSGSQNWSDNGVSSEVACGALAAAAKRLRKARLAAAPAGSKEGSSSGASGHAAGSLGR